MRVLMTLMLAISFLPGCESTGSDKPSVDWSASDGDSSTNPSDPFGGGTGGGTDGDPDGDDGYGPAIQVDPALLNFGLLANGEESVETFTISSVGEDVLEVSSLEVLSEDSSFTILTELGTGFLPVGEQMDIDVAFSPMSGGTQLGQAIVRSNATGDAEVAIELLGDGAVAELQIFPDPLNIGTAYVGCETTEAVELRNVGTEDLEVYSVTQEGESFALDSDLDLPLTLAPDEAVSMYLDFRPTVDGEESGTVTVTSSEPLGTRTAVQTGIGEYASYHDDEWIVPSNPPVDIIFYVDQSCSMEDDQAALSAQFSTFITEMNAYSTDWQIIVSNQDNGCNQTGILRPTDSDYVTRFQSAVSAGGGWLTEAGLTITSEAVDKTDSGQCNDGFLRDEAMLHIIMVSDESEQSSSTWNWYVDKVVAKKGSSTRVKFSAIVGDYPGGCETAEAGDGYYQAVTATDGVFLSICSDWAIPSNMRLLAEASAGHGFFEPVSTVLESTMQVFVNGEERTSGWYLDEAENMLVFDESLPEEGDTVRLLYAGPAECSR